MDPQGPLFVLGIVAFYAVLCWFNPWAECGRCKGEKRIYRTDKKRGYAKRCPRCKGTGIRLRHGRRAYNYATRTRDRAHTRPVKVEDAEQNRWR